MFGTKYIRLDNMEVRRTNGTLLGSIKLDRFWGNYRFHPDEHYFGSFDIIDMEEIIKIMELIERKRRVKRFINIFS